MPSDTEPVEPFRLTLARTIELEATDDIQGHLSRLSAQENWFAVIFRDAACWVQTGGGDSVGASPGCFVLERRSGVGSDVLRCEVADLHRVVAAFEGFAAGSESWHEDFTWAALQWEG